MAAYMAEIEERRSETSASDRELKDLQAGDGTGTDKLAMWKKMKDEVRARELSLLLPTPDHSASRVLAAG
eukprot:3015147-Prymnesium_polylepis.1